MLWLSLAILKRLCSVPDVASFYKNQIKEFKGKLSEVNQRLFGIGMLRLGIFLLAVLAIWFLNNQIQLLVLLLVLALVLFLYLVSRHTDLRYERDKILALIKLNETELQVLDPNFENLLEGNEFRDPDHYFSQDIDVFGRGSFYQYCNRTVLAEGSAALAKILKENSIENIPQKQEAIKELGGIPQWRQDFLATASLVKTGMPNSRIVKWMKEYESFLPSWMKHAPLVFSILGAAIILAYFLGWISGWAIGAVFLFGLIITGRYLKRINKLSLDTSKIQTTFRQYQRLIFHLEEIDFQSHYLKRNRGHILTESEKVSVVLKKFSRLLHAFDQRHNILVAFFANGFLLRDLKLAFAMEQWIGKYRFEAGNWFETVAFFDSQISLGNFAFNHPNYVYPKITASDTVLSMTGAAHPLMDSAQAVTNDFKIGSEEFFIITGANMAGKSTFLRTVSLHIMMANLGLPVCASSSEYNPIKLITSMRTTDSLTDDESYFFSELKRLKFIVDKIGVDKYFIVLDEILKGTNSTDKARGSRKFVERLVNSNSTGIIATHDLSLCDTAKDFNEVENYYFDAEIKDDELHFDYTLKKGICQNMNASFLLKKMGIVE